MRSFCIVLILAAASASWAAALVKSMSASLSDNSFWASSCALIASTSSKESALSAVSAKKVTSLGWISINPPEQKKVSSPFSVSSLTGPGARPVNKGVCPGAYQARQVNRWRKPF